MGGDDGVDVGVVVGVEEGVGEGDLFGVITMSMRAMGAIVRPIYIIQCLNSSFMYGSQYSMRVSYNWRNYLTTVCILV